MQFIQSTIINFFERNFFCYLCSQISTSLDLARPREEVSVHHRETRKRYIVCIIILACHQAGSMG